MLSENVKWGFREIPGTVDPHSETMYTVSIHKFPGISDTTGLEIFNGNFQGVFLFFVFIYLCKNVLLLVLNA